MIWNFCIRRPVLTLVVFAAIAIFGIFGYMQMPVQENPDVDFPIVSVTVVLPGGAPEVVESEIIEPLEEQINTIEGLRELQSTAGEQSARIIAEFELWRDVDVAAQDVRDRLDRAMNDLPAAAERPILRKVDPSDQAIMWVTLVGDERWDEVSMTEYVEQQLKPQLETLGGVGQIQVGGERRYAVRIRLDPQRLAAHHLTVQDVVEVIRAENVEIPSGRVEGLRREFLVQTRGQFDSAAPFNDLIVRSDGDSTVRLGDVGEAVDAVENDRQVARFTGRPTVGMGVLRLTGANTVEVAQAVRQQMERIEPTLPAGLEYNIATDDSEFVQESINDLQVTIFLATGLVVLVVLAFLRSGRGTLVVACAIPTSLLAGLFAMSVMGFTLNTLTMLGLILVIGIVIDDAIVVLERNYRHMEEGAEAKPAARVGTTEVAFPAIANTLSLCAVFLPVAFTGGMIGRFFMEFGLTVAVTVIASTFTALTLTPMLCSRLLRYQPTHGRVFHFFERAFVLTERGYQWLLRWAFRLRWLTVLLGVAAFGAGMLAFSQVSREFQPDVDRSSMAIFFETPQGATLGETDAFARQIEALVEGDPNAQHFFMAIGLGAAGTGDVNSGIVFIRLIPRDQRDLHQSEVINQMRGRLAQLSAGTAFALDLGGGGGQFGQPIQAAIQHADLAMLADIQDELTTWMRGRDAFVNVDSNLQMNRPQVDVHVHRDKASQMGVSVASIATTLQYLMGSPAISEIERASRRYDVIPEIMTRGQDVPRTLAELYVRNADGELVSLDNLVELEETVGPSEIHHFNRLRSVTVEASDAPGVAMGDAVDELETWLQRELPAGVTYELTGTAQLMEESFYYLSITIVLAIVFIYLVLAAQFESFIFPLTILTTLPLATAGAFGALWLFDMDFNVFGFIGLIMLMGLVTKNGILLVDYTNVLVARGRPVVDAAQEAAGVRFRPVLMTAVSTILGMMPIALGYGAGAEARSPLGISVVAGLAVATVLTLIVIPVVYTLIDAFTSAVGRLARRMRRRQPMQERAA